MPQTTELIESQHQRQKYKKKKSTSVTLPLQELFIQKIKMLFLTSFKFVISNLFCYIYPTVSK